LTCEREAGSFFKLCQSKGERRRVKENRGKHKSATESKGEDWRAKESIGERRRAKESKGERSRAKRSEGEQMSEKESEGEQTRAKERKEEQRGEKESKGEQRRAKRSKGEQQGAKQSRAKESKGVMLHCVGRAVRRAGRLAASFHFFMFCVVVCFVSCSLLFLCVIWRRRTGFSTALPSASVDGKMSYYCYY